MCKKNGGQSITFFFIARLLVLFGILSLVNLGCFGLCLAGLVIYSIAGGREDVLGVQ
jgi:nitrate reductase NapE component